MEVEATVSAVVGLRDCVVYGVEIPGTEGRWDIKYFFFLLINFALDW